MFNASLSAFGSTIILKMVGGIRQGGVSSLWQRKCSDISMAPRTQKTPLSGMYFTSTIIFVPTGYSIITFRVLSAPTLKGVVTKTYQTPYRRGGTVVVLPGPSFMLLTPWITMIVMYILVLPNYRFTANK